MRISIHLSEEEHARREALLQDNPDEMTDSDLGIVADAIWEAFPEGLARECEGVDLRDPLGKLLYTIVGDPL